MDTLRLSGLVAALLLFAACGAEAAKGGNGGGKGNNGGNKYELLIEWDDPGLTAIVSFNIYRDYKCGTGPLTNRIDTIPAGPFFTYVDKTVPVSQKQVCYEVTSVDKNGQESAHSKRLQSRLP